MSAGLVSLIVVTVAFVALVIWVFSPRRKRRLESHGRIPLDDDREGRQ